MPWRIAINLLKNRLGSHSKHRQAQSGKVCIEKYQTLAFLSNKSNPIWAKKQGVFDEKSGQKAASQVGQQRKQGRAQAPAPPLSRTRRPDQNQKR
ncbi:MULTISPECIES: hypothetical protein [Chromobacterium]|uniref:Uncharacterized protein n=1 Tax=Chromobacterium aquaticum TaxID=467180 RepID=A0ABV8ZQM1_9NEIS|nr:hypothetical protein [Chromobacterium aquaticum]MCD5362181.1 hypothetical protein [Chromobacterium aquaticum]